MLRITTTLYPLQLIMSIFILGLRNRNKLNRRYSLRIQKMSSKTTAAARTKTYSIVRTTPAALAEIFPIQLFQGM